MPPSDEIPPDAWVHDDVEGWTIDGASDDPAILDAGTRLLDRELPDPRFVSSDYLRWAYRENPLGRAVERYQHVPVDGEVRLAAHYANMPRRFRGVGGERSDGMWSLNAVVHADHQRARHFSRIGLEIYEEADRAGKSFVVGITNAKSTGAVVKYMGWRLAGPLPVRIVPVVGRGHGSMRHRWVDRAWLASDDFEQFAASVDRHDVVGWVTDYDTDVLRWRLGCPETSYAVHVADDVVLVTTKSSYGPVPACVVLKVFPVGDPDGVVDATRAIRTVTRWHRAAFAVYAGFSASVRVRGMQPPRRLQPSPLNLIIRHLDPTIDQDSIVLDSFEFLDMDAY